MYVYHEVDPSAVRQIMHDGLKRTSRGEKGGDSLIAMTDHFLDARRPLELLRKGLSRDNNLYAYFSDGDTIIDIINGEPVSSASFIRNSDRAVLRLNVDATKCYVSDLDAYDELKKQLEAKNEAKAAELSKQYWRKLIPLLSFSSRSLARPEVMITYDIEPRDIRCMS